MFRSSHTSLLFYLLFRPQCRGCGKTIGRYLHDFCFSCRRDFIAPAQGSFLFAHEGIGKNLVSAMRGEAYFLSADWAFRLLQRRGWSANWKNAGIQVITLPPRAKARREDGLPVLAQKIAEEIGAIYQPLLKKQKGVSQHGRDRDARMNCRPFVDLVSGAAPIDGKKVLLLDDVDTTGSTLELCAYRLRQAGAAEVALFSVARQMMESFERKSEEPTDEGEEMQPFLFHLFV